MDVVLGGRLTDLDRVVLDSVGPVEAGWQTELAALLADTGHWPLQGGFLLALAALVAAVRRSVRPLQLVAVALVLVGLGGSLTKVLLARTAPWSGTDLVFSDGSAYPSGHAAGAVVVGLLTAHLLLPVANPEGLPGRAARLLVLLIGVAWPVLMGWSRIHLGVHWASDVLGGWLLGFAVVTGVFCINLGSAWIKPPGRRTRGTCSTADTLPAPGRSPRRPTGPGGPR